MNSAALVTLIRIGDDLDNDRFPRSKNGGLIVPSDEIQPTEALGKENVYGNSRQAGSSTRPRKRTTGWERPSGRPRSADPPAQLRIGGLQEQFESQLNAVSEAYPSLTVWQQSLGAWMLLDSAVLDGLNRHARLAVAVPFTADRIRAWGFWEGVLEPARWIGPRHTNFPEGSICAYDINARNPPGAHDLVGLLDFYTLWAFRHLHLEVTGRWPGRHVGAFVSERLFEVRPEEFCGCGSEGVRYRHCCQDADRRGSRVAEAVDYAFTFLQRKVPREVVEFVQGGEPPPVELFTPPPGDGFGQLLL